MLDSTLRFSGRAENYLKYRPRYPRGIIDALRDECGLVPACRIADVGSGTGALTELFLENGNQVYAVEPNPDMRGTAERLLRSYPGFHSIAGRAESTALDGKSVDFAVVGQAFHWFDVPETRREFLRILVPWGWAMVTWNEREFEATPFMIAYDQLLQQYAPDYARVRHRQVYDTALGSFFGGNGFRTLRFPYRQELDLAGVKGRMLSSSYTPEPGHPNHSPLFSRLSEVFSEHAVAGLVTLQYITWMYYGRLSP